MKRLLIVMLALISSCTVVGLNIEKYDAEGNLIESISANYSDWHPGGNAVEAEAVWENVGLLDIKRETEDSDVAAGVVEGAINAVIN